MAHEDVENLAAQLGSYLEARQIVAMRDDQKLLWPELFNDLDGAILASANGRIPQSELSRIPNGWLRHDAARGWNDMREHIGKRHGIWINPTGPNSSYRTYAAQQYFWDLYQSGRGNLAAYPGTSNHGWGVAVDVATPTMVFYIRKYGHIFGWKKTEAFSEWWHYNYVGGYRPGPKRPALPKVLTDKEEKWSQLLIYHRHERKEEESSGKGKMWHAHNHWAKHYDDVLRRHVAKLKGKRFKRVQRRHALLDIIAGKYNF